MRWAADRGAWLRRTAARSAGSPLPHASRATSHLLNTLLPPGLGGRRGHLLSHRTALPSVASTPPGGPRGGALPLPRVGVDTIPRGYAVDNSPARGNGAPAGARWTR